jgi:type I restriction enzyme S subunit
VSIPRAGWKVVRLGEALDLLIDHRGQTPKKLGGEFLEAGVPAISAIHIKRGRVDFSQRERFVSQALFERWMPQRLRRGDVLMTSEAPMGSLAFVPSDAPIVLSQRLFGLRGREGVLDNRYLRWALESDAVRRQLNRRSSGTTVTGIRQSELVQVELELPSVQEQLRIVEIVEDHLSRLDAADAELAHAARRLKAFHKSVLLHTIPDSADYPADWRTSTVQQAGNIDLGRQRHPDWHTGPNMKPYLRVANVFEDRIDTSSMYEMHWPGDTFERFQLRSGDVLLNEGQTPELLGRPALYRGQPPAVAFTNSLIRFRAGDGVLPEFALLVFRRHMHAGRFTKESRITTNIAHLSAARLKSVEFPIPPLHVQQQLVDLAQQQLAAMSRLRSETTAALARSARLRRALLEAAFSGQLP